MNLSVLGKWVDNLKYKRDDNRSIYLKAIWRNDLHWCVYILLLKFAKFKSN